MRRALAALAAVAMIVVAVLVRGALDDKQQADTPAIRLVCVPELEAVCRALRADTAEKTSYTVEAPSVTAARLTALGDGAVPPLDLWLAPAPWAAIVEARRDRAARATLLEVPATPVARSPLVVVAWRDRAQPLTSRCPNRTLSWRCVGEAVAAPSGWAGLGGDEAWGRVKLGVASPEQDGSGLAVLGDAVRGFFGRSALSSADLDDDAFADWFAPVAKAVTRSAGTGAPLARMLTIGRSMLEVVGTTEAEVASLLLASPARAAELTIVYPAPNASAVVDAAVAGTSGVRARATALARSDRLGSALRAAAWRVPPNQERPPGAAAGAPARLSSANPVPSSGFLEALLTRWKTVAG